MPTKMYVFVFTATELFKPIVARPKFNTTVESD